METSTLLLIIIIGLAGIAYFWYASIISKRNKALEALSGIDVQLQKRLDVIPNILKIAKKFLEHEKSLLEEITALRAQADKDYNKAKPDEVAQHLEAAKQLTGKMGQLMIQVEAYPDLKSDQTMMQAMQSYNEVEAGIAAARRFYNSAVNALRNATQIFPGNIIAGWAGVDGNMPFYEAEEAAAKSIDADSIL